MTHEQTRQSEMIYSMEPGDRITLQAASGVPVEVVRNENGSFDFETLRFKQHCITPGNAEWWWFRSCNVIGTEAEGSNLPQAEPTRKPMLIQVCDDCGGWDLQEVEWLNTATELAACGDPYGGEVVICNDCGDPVGTTMRDATPEEERAILERQICEYTERLEAAQRQLQPVDRQRPRFEPLEVVRVDASDRHSGTAEHVADGRAAICSGPLTAGQLAEQGLHESEEGRWFWVTPKGRAPVALPAEELRSLACRVATAAEIKDGWETFEFAEIDEICTPLKA